MRVKSENERNAYEIETCNPNRERVGGKRTEKTEVMELGWRHQQLLASE